MSSKPLVSVRRNTRFAMSLTGSLGRTRLERCGCTAQAKPSQRASRTTAQRDRNSGTRSASEDPYLAYFDTRCLLRRKTRHTGGAFFNAGGLRCRSLVLDGSRTRDRQVKHLLLFLLSYQWPITCLAFYMPGWERIVLMEKLIDTLPRRSRLRAPNMSP